MYDIFGSDISSNKITLSGMVFSKREVEVLSFICSGRPHKVVAEALNLSVRTVETHVRNIVGKSGLGSMDRLLEHLTNSGDVHLLKKVYVHVLYMNDFSEFIKSLGRFNISLSIFGDSLNDRKALEVKNTLKDMFEIDGEPKGINNIKVFIRCKKSSDTNIDDIRAEYIINVYDDGVILSILHFLRNFGNKNLVETQINKYKTIVGGIDNKSTLDGNNLEWSDNMKKGGKYGLLVSSGLALAVIGYLYGIYPYSDSSECVSNMKMLISDHVHLSRDRLFEDIKKSLEVSSSNPIRVAALVGPGGSGKTTLARMLMQHYKERREYGLVFEVNAESVDSARNSLLSCAWALAKDDEKLSSDLSAISATSNADKRHKKVMEFIRKQMDPNKKWMFVFDNVEDIKEIKPLMPTSPDDWRQGQILITTRDPDIKGQVVDLLLNVHEIGQLTSSEKRSLFFKILSHIDKSKKSDSFPSESVDRLLNIIPPYPLDVSTIACSIAGRNISIEDYIEKLEKNTLPFDRSKAKTSDTDYGKTRYGIVISAVNDMIEDAKQLKISDKDIKSLFLLLSMCDSQRIGTNLFNRFSPSASHYFIKGLDEYYFIDKLVNDKFSVHRVVQDILFDNLTTEQMSSKELEEFFKTLFNNVFNYDDITCEYRTNATGYRYEKTFFDSTVSVLKNLCSVIDNIDDKKLPNKKKYKAKALAAYSGILLVRGGNYKDIVSYLNEAIELDDYLKNNNNSVFSDYDRAIIYYQLWSAQSQYDLEGSKKHIETGLKLQEKLGNDALPLKISYQIDEYVSRMMSGEKCSNDDEFQKLVNELPDNNTYWRTLALARLQLYSEDFRLQNSLFDKGLAAEVATKFSNLLNSLGAGNIDDAIKLAKEDKMPKIVASIMVELVWAHTLAGNYGAAETAYLNLKRYLKEGYPMTKYELRGDTYRVAILSGRVKTSKDKKILNEAYKLGKNTIKNWELVGSDSMVYETLADYGKILICKGEKGYNELIKYAKKYNKGTDLEGPLQILINAKLFYYYGVACMEQGEIDAANDYFKKSLKHFLDLKSRISCATNDNEVCQDSVQCSCDTNNNENYEDCSDTNQCLRSRIEAEFQSIVGLPTIDRKYKRIINKFI